MPRTRKAPRRRPAAVGRQKGRTIGGMARTGALENELDGKARNEAVMERVRADRIANGDVGRPEDIDWHAPVRVWRADE